MIKTQVGSINDWPITMPHTLGGFVGGESIQVEFPAIGKARMVSKGNPRLLGIRGLENNESVVILPFPLLSPAFYRVSIWRGA